MKTLCAAAAITIATVGASSAMAADNGLFVGAEFGRAKFDTELLNKATGAKVGDSGKLDVYGLRFGTYLNDNARVYANLNQGEADEKVGATAIKTTNRQLTISADYVFDLDVVKPFVGATVGTNWTEIKIASEKDSNYAFAYGAQAGRFRCI